MAELAEMDPDRFPLARSEAFLEKATQNPRAFVAPQLDVQIQPLTDGRQAVRFAYDPVLVTLLHKMRVIGINPGGWWILLWRNCRNVWARSLGLT